MDEREFWDVIDESRAGLVEGEVSVELLRAKLMGMSRQEIDEFYICYVDVFERLHSYNVYLVGGLINGAMLSGDGFRYFRSWLIFNGEWVVSSALKDPELIADKAGYVKRALEGEGEYEDFYYIFEDVYQELFGVSVYDVPIPLLLETEDIGYVSLDEAKRRLPKLAKAVELSKGDNVF